MGVLFYRAHLLSGNTEFVDALVREIEQQGANALPVYAYSLKEEGVFQYFAGGVDVVISTHELCDGSRAQRWPDLERLVGRGAAAAWRAGAAGGDGGLEPRPMGRVAARIVGRSRRP